MGSNPSQGNYRFPQKLSSVEFPLTSSQLLLNLDCESICDPPGGDTLLAQGIYLTDSLYIIYIYIYIYIRQNKCGKPNEELPVEGSRKDTLLQFEFVDKCKAMNMKQTSNCSGFNMDVLAFGLLQTWNSTYLQVKR